MSQHNHTTFYIYRIVCFPTGKVYVGQTVNPKLRKKTHFVSLKSKTHDNSHLQHAYDKYGRSAFYFEIIESGLSADEVGKRETEWIAYFDSYNNGFNMTTGGEYAFTTEGKACEWNGIAYASIRAAARALGIDKTGMSRRLAKGYKSDADLKHIFSVQQCEWNGVIYASISDAARACGINPATMLWRIEKGYKQDSDIPRRNEPRKITWNGIEYPTIHAAAEALGISQSWMSVRLKKGYSCDADLDLDYEKRRKPQKRS